MKRLAAVIEFAVFLSLALASAQDIPPQADFRATPPALKLLAGDVVSGCKRVQASQRAKNLAEENLRMQEERFQVGLVTQKDVIDFQSRLIDARARNYDR